MGRPIGTTMRINDFQLPAAAYARIKARIQRAIRERPRQARDVRYALDTRFTEERVPKAVRLTLTRRALLSLQAEGKAVYRRLRGQRVGTWSAK